MNAIVFASDEESERLVFARWDLNVCAGLLHYVCARPHRLLLAKTVIVIEPPFVKRHSENLEQNNNTFVIKRQNQLFVGFQWSFKPETLLRSYEHVFPQNNTHLLFELSNLNSCFFLYSLHNTLKREKCLFKVISEREMLVMALDGIYSQ
jgi:hypothetical protein